MKNSIGLLLVLMGSFFLSCKDQTVSLEIDPVSFSLIDDHVLSESSSTFNAVFLVSGKSCFACSEDIVHYINDFEGGKHEVTVIGNDPQIKEVLNKDIKYVGLEQLELERHGFKMSDSEIYVFDNEDLIYQNIVSESEFENINKIMKELNE